MHDLNNLLVEELNKAMKQLKKRRKKDIEKEEEEHYDFKFKSFAD